MKNLLRISFFYLPSFFLEILRFILKEPEDPALYIDDLEKTKNEILRFGNITDKQIDNNLENYRSRLINSLLDLLGVSDLEELDETVKNDVIEYVDDVLIKNKELQKPSFSTLLKLFAKHDNSSKA